MDRSRILTKRHTAYRGHGRQILLVEGQLVKERDGVLRLRVVLWLGLQSVERQECNSSREMLLVHQRNDFGGGHISVHHNVEQTAATRHFGGSNVLGGT